MQGGGTLSFADAASPVSVDRDQIVHAIDSGATLQAESDYDQTGGSTVLDGGSLNGGNINFEGGSLTGTGDH